MPRLLYSFPWHLCPTKDLAWLEEQRSRLPKDAFAREILISYDFSVSGTVFSEFTNDHILEGDYQFNSNLPLYRAIDFGRTCAALFAQKDSYGRFFFFKELILEPASTTALAQAVKNISSDYTSFATKPFDTCDPAGNTVSYTANSTDIEILSEHDILPHYDKIQRCKDRLQEGISLIKKRLSERNEMASPTIRISRRGCPILIEAFQSGYKYKVNRSTQEITDVIDERHPYEDVMDCLRYTLMQFGNQETAKISYQTKISPFMPTKNPNWKPSSGLLGAPGSQRHKR